MSNCKLCLKEITDPKRGQRYHPECFKRSRKDYQAKWWVSKRTLRYNVDVLKQEVNEIEERIIKKVLERIKK